MTEVLPALPAEVMEALAPAFAAVDRQVSAAVRATMRQRMERAGVAAVRALGYRETHEEGFDAIMAKVFGVPAPLARGEAGKDRGVGYRDPDELEPYVPVAFDPAHVPDDVEDDDERTCECAGCEARGCQGDCDACGDTDCAQCHGDCDYDCDRCHDVRPCCGYCDRCEEHHDGYTDDRCIHCDHCTECDHTCTNY